MAASLRHERDQGTVAKNATVAASSATGSVRTAIPAATDAAILYVAGDFNTSAYYAADHSTVIREVIRNEPDDEL